MQQVIHNLITALRNSGVRISVSESLDAMHAVKFIGYQNRLILKDALSATLAKSKHETEIFDICFDRLFSADSFSGDASFEPKKESLKEPETEPEENLQLARLLLSQNNNLLSQSMQAAASRVNINEITFFTQKGLYIRKILQGMGIKALEDDIKKLGKSNRASDMQKAGALVDAKDLLIQNVRNFVEKQFKLFAGKASEKIEEEYLKHVKLSNMEQRDFKRMHEIIKKMVKRLNDLHSRKKKIAKRGWLDLKKTVRSSAPYGGIVMEPRWKTKKIDRPDIVAICDVSRSVEAVVRFMLLFLYSLNDELARIRSFIFCSNLVEAGHVFREYEVEEALTRLLKGTGLNISLQGTDYGQAFIDFKENWLNTVTNKTTIIFLGDARNNFGNPQIRILRLLQERSKRIIWLNPEPPTFWNTGDSEMKKYAPFCFLTKECSTINDLKRVVDFLLRK